MVEAVQVGCQGNGWVQVNDKNRKRSDSTFDPTFDVGKQAAMLL